MADVSPQSRRLYGMSAFMKSIDTKLIGRKTYERSLRLGATFDSTNSRNVIFPVTPPPRGSHLGTHTHPHGTSP